LETLNELPSRMTPCKLHLMSALRIKINGMDYLFFGPTINDPDNKFNVQEIEDMGIIPMLSVTEMLERVQTGEQLYDGVQ